MIKEQKWDDVNKVGGKYMAGVIADFAPALKEIAKLGSMNNKPNGKYDRGSWKLVKNPEVQYTDAFWRHLLEGSHEIDPETGMPHDVAIAWNALALICFRLKREAIEAEESESEQDKAERDFHNDFHKSDPFYKFAWMIDYCIGRNWPTDNSQNLAEAEYAYNKHEVGDSHE